MPSITLYVSEINEAIIEKAKEMLDRENSSLSKLFIKTVQQYVRLHEPGNPQQRLDTIIKIGKAFKAETCQDCNLAPVKWGLKNTVWLGYCEVHWNPRRFRVTRDKPPYKTIKVNSFKC